MTFGPNVLGFYILKKNNSNKTMDQLPLEMSLKVFQQFSLNELLQFRLVTTLWNERICQLFGTKIYYNIDPERIARHGNVLNETICALSQEMTDNAKVCISKIDLLQKEQLQDESIRSALGRVKQFRVGDCLISLNILSFILNRIQQLEKLTLNVLLDKSVRSNMVFLEFSAFDSLTELDLSKSRGMDDQTFKWLAEGMHNLKIFNCAETKMFFYPNYIRRYYQHHDDIDGCWLRPTIFGFTFNIVRALITTVTNKLEQIHIGPNVCIENALQLATVDHLKDVHFLFHCDTDQETFQNKVADHPDLQSCIQKFHYHTINLSNQ